ncbi:MAG: tRNA (adenosine(37)-N6)-threonylcarbamoyltransferase complex transferase subunit TsaD [Gemmatimonadaceae bacterium]|nr:tRNA (adenosine(37)-N6)-threonylcarbamoyltransferase complex transferase subunit TsaD [Gemmatimonadaceae bacterium]MCW5825834.1 tRNA (adenosine(37)-N6)-threonylcarbamoyltransferase complex transferase subunit TsaD [Gemmatimonadaceae bacterium]
MRILGIETSCDETSAAVLSGNAAAPQLDSLVILSQDVHSVFGGVVPEIASREHLTAIVPVTERALADAGTTLADVDAIAVTHAPGLVGALLVGVSYAKALGAAAGKPVIGVHHMEGHLFATALEHPDATPPFTALLVSGGHTLLLDVAEWGAYRLLGRTRDDAAGEAFDKAAKLLGLPYPGGRHLEALARDGDPKRHRFTKPMLNAGQKPGDADYYDVSFSGLKTAVLLATQQASDLEAEKPHIARGFQDALIGTLVAKTIRAAKAQRRKKIVLGGGVACNAAVVDAMRSTAKELGAEVFAPTPRLATDNAAMIAAAGLFRFARGERSDATLNAHSALPIPGVRSMTDD